MNPCSTTYFPPLLFELNDYKACGNLGRLQQIGVRYVISDGPAPMFAGCPGRDRRMQLISQDRFFRVERLVEAR